MSNKRMSKKHFANIVVTLSITSILAYTAATFICLVMAQQSPPAELTTAFFAFFGGEMLALAGIKINKTKNITSSETDDTTI